MLEEEGYYRKEGLREWRRTKSREDGGLVCNLRKKGGGRRGIGREEAYEIERRW